ncbi:MAG: Gfo/Idh/MocA family oxidoreductase [Planctomycetales bacterium]
MSDPMRWGVMGTGGIAAKFAAEAPENPSGELVAVGSRSAERARDFADQFGIERSGDYDFLLNDQAVDAVYISLPNSLHHPWTLRALEAGKHVLCEKPIAADADQAVEMFDAAERAGRLLVEAFMYRAHPVIDKTIALVRGGTIGDLKLIRSHFTFNRDADPANVRYQPDLAGGSLMDVGCYCVNLARAIAGSEPTGMQVVAHRHETGVDDYAAGVLDFGGETLCAFTCGMTVESDRTTFIAGSQGHLELDLPWFSDGSLRIVKPDQTETIVVESRLPAYALEAHRFATAARDEEPPWLTREDSIGNMRVLDALRRQAGLI